VTADLPSTSSYGDLARYTSTLLDFETDSHAWILPLLAKLRVGEGVNFDGLGGDVLYQFNWTYVDEAAHIDDPAYLARAVLQEYPDLWNSYFRIDSPEPSLAERFEQTFRNLPNFEDRFTAFYFTNWTRRKTALLSQGLLSLKIDSVFPYLDYDLVDHVFRLPPVIRRSSEISKAMLHLANPDFMRKIPTSHDERLASENDEFCRPFRRPLPRNYWVDSQASICRAAAVDIMKTDDVLFQLSRRAQLLVIGHWIARSKWCMPRRFVQSSWRLPLVGLYARQRRTARSKSEAALRLSAANAYVYGR
jgi:hypothetical protein